MVECLRHFADLAGMYAANLGIDAGSGRGLCRIAERAGLCWGDTHLALQRANRAE